MKPLAIFLKVIVIKTVIAEQTSLDEIVGGTSVENSDDDSDYFTAYVNLPKATSEVVLNQDNQLWNVSRVIELNPKPTNYTWFKDDVLITRKTKEISLNNNTIFFTPLSLSDIGIYTVRACNELECKNDNFFLKVLLEIEENTMQDQSVSAHSNVHFRCELKYYPKNYPTAIKEINFYHTKVTNSTDFSKLPEDLISDRTLINVTEKDEGWYSCFYVYEIFNETYTVLAHQSAFLYVKPVLPITAIVVTTVFLVAIALAILIIFLYQQTKLKRKYYERWVKVVTVTKNQDTTGCVHLPKVSIQKQRIRMVQNSCYDSALFLEYEYPVDLEWEIKRDRLILGKKLGEGAFGQIMLAEAIGPEGENIFPVAVKMLKDNHSDDDVKDLVSELEIMKMIGRHPNVISLLGCCSNEGPLYVIIEYAAHGNLKNFLLSHRFEENYEQRDKNAISTHQLITFAIQIASGMEYLASIKCIHRDLAARNILVAEGYVMKIADFGLARDVQDHEYYRKMTAGKVPIRWMAPESLEHFFFDSRTDVWSFGVLLWEIMTLGRQPYLNVTSWEYQLQYLKQGNRLEKPAQCPDSLYAVMRGCWQLTPQQRPSFGEIVQHMKLCSDAMDT